MATECLTLSLSWSGRVCLVVLLTGKRSLAGQHWPLPHRENHLPVSVLCGEIMGEQTPTETELWVGGQRRVEDLSETSGLRIFSIRMNHFHPKSKF